VKLRGQRNSPRPTESLREARQHRQVGVKLNLLQTANAKRCESVVMLQAPELARRDDRAPRTPRS